MRRALRAVNVAVAFVTLLSALAVLGSSLFEAGYRLHHDDSLLLVAVYAAAHALILVEFARDGRLVPWLAIGKALAAYVFLLTFPAVGGAWMAMTPGRYVYSLFSGEVVRFPMFAFVYLGRGAWNTLNAFYFTAPWWRPLRMRRPLVGRLVTLVPITIVVYCVWAFLDLLRYEARTFSPEAHEIARLVFDGLECDAVRSRNGDSADDTRQRGDRRYDVHITYGCGFTSVVVRAEDGRFGVAGGPRPECCEAGS